MVAADGVAAEHHPAGGGHIVDHDVGVLAPCDLGQGDQIVEAVAKDRVPGLDGAADRGELLLGGAGWAWTATVRLVWSYQ
jgi:hypothetical protein